MSLTRPWCDKCGTTPKLGAQPTCSGCRFILGLPRGRNNKGPLTRQTLLNRMKGEERRAHGPRCGIVTANGIACARYSTGPCRWHRLGTLPNINSTKTPEVA